MEIYKSHQFYDQHEVLDRSKFSDDELIPVIEIINKDIYKDGSTISSHSSASKVRDHLYNNAISDPSQPPIDLWIPRKEDKIFTHIRGAIIAPIHRFYGLSDTDPANTMLDYFYVTAKRCYNSDTRMKEGKLSIGFRDHCTTYINYFEKYYDKELQLLNLYSFIKYLIDCKTDSYSLEMFFHDLWKYLINPNASYQAQYLNYKIDMMNNDQYNLELRYKNNKSPILEYNDIHAKLLLKISIMQNMMIPLITHFIIKKKIASTEVKNVLLRAFDMLFKITKEFYNIDLVSKIHETTFSNVSKSTSNNPILWDMQYIRGRNSTTHSIETVENIIMQIIPKYTYDKNIIHFNYNAINRDIKFRVIDVPYEFSFVQISSSIRDDDNNSECDKFEAHAVKLNEAILIQTQTNCRTTMERIMMKYGPFDDREIKFYYDEMCRDGKFIINSLQKTLVMYLFDKEFEDPQAAKIVNIKQYIILIIAARRLLASYKLFQLPYMIGGKVTRTVSRKNINKREIQKIEQSRYYEMIHEKYNNEKIEHDVILNLISQILSSEFKAIDYYNQENNGILINVVPDIITEEICRFIMLI